MNRRSPLSIPGVYTLTDTISGRVYVGAARNVRKRWEAHRHALKNGKHRNRYLQHAWDEHGAEAFRFELIVDLSEVPPDDLVERLNAEEDAALSRYPDTYNLMQDGTAAEVTRQLLSQRRRAMWADPVLRERRIEAMKKKAADPEHQKRRGAGIAAYRNRPEVKAAVSEQMTDLWADPEHRKAMSAKRKANWQDEEYRTQQAESRSETWQDPEVREKRRAGMREAWVRRKAAAARAELPAPVQK